MTFEHLAVLGPTCSWKSAVAVVLAERLHGEILNCDSMQVYRGMDIGTAKPERELLSRVRHHLVDCLPLSARCDAALYTRMAESVLDQLERRGVLAVLVGGTGLYARSLIYGSRLLPSDRSVAQDLVGVLATHGGRERLVQELATYSGDTPLPKSVIDNPRRLLRAVEVARITGATPWQLHSQPTPPPRHTFRQYILMPAMRILRERIAARTSAMLREGWIAEAATLIAQGMLSTATARQALGYRDIAAFLDGSIASCAELEEQLLRRTLSYARRQRTWFGHQHPGAIIIDIDREVTPDEIAEAILQHRQQWPDTTAKPQPVGRIHIS